MPLQWIFDPAPPSGARKGGLANAHVFNPTLDAFAREVLQNAQDQRLGSQGADVRFTLREITGPALDEFLAGIAWPHLHEHIEAAADPDLVTIGPRLREGIDEITTHGRLRLMRIDDAGTRGLTGGEDDDSNFAALARHELITSGERRQSGGSFGLGKSVLWRFSGLSTVLFSSLISEENRFRYIGRTVLPAHEAEAGVWEGSGWFGAEDPERARAVSVFDEDAREIAQRTQLDRPWPVTGTSILVVGFDEQAGEEREVEEICGDMVKSSTRWFWPALLKDGLTVLVEGYKDDEQVFARHAQATNAEVAPFVHAQQDSPDVEDVIENPGDVAAKDIKVTVPRQRPERFKEPRAETEARAALRIRLAESGENEGRNTVALQRGTGMVVNYQEVRTRAGDQPFHAVLLAGLAHGDSDADQSLEEFLRAAEPPAHEEWTSTTERIKAEYGYGFKKALDQLFGQIEAAIRDLTREEVTDSDEGPDALRRLFPIPGVGASPREESFRLADTRAQLDGDQWQFSGRFARKPTDEAENKRDWAFRVALFLDQEGSGRGSARGQRVPVRELAVDGKAKLGEVNPDGTVDVVVPAAVKEVPFSGTSEAITDLPLGGLRRVRLRMDLRSVKPEEVSV
jgi:hypothetical protein